MMFFLDVLFGVVFFLAGAAMLFFPPKKINRFYGYRTPRSMKSQAAWKEGNSYSAKLLLLSGVVAIFVALVSGYAVPKYSRYLVLGTVFILLLLCILLTELRLKKLFDKNGDSN